MKSNLYARKLRQLKRLSTALNLHARQDNKHANLIRKIKALVLELRTVCSSLFIKKALAGCSLALALFFNNQAQAQSFLAPVSNPFNIDSVAYIGTTAVYDFDNDGDYDILTAGDDTLNFFYFIPNIGTPSVPNFGTPVPNPFGINFTPTGYNSFQFPTAVDLDNDGDLDLVSGQLMGSLVYFENTGTQNNPQFGPQQDDAFGISAGAYVAVPTFVDIDNDGDKDLFVGEYYGTVVYFQNTGTATVPVFAPGISNPFNIVTDPVNYLAFPTFSDLDGDGDKDMLMGNYYFTQFQYFENTGTANAPDFAAPTTNPFGLDQGNILAMPSNLVDMDNDGDKDLFSGFYYGGMNYYENTSGIGASVEEVQLSFDTKIYPSPTSDVLHLDFKGKIEDVQQIEVLDASGKICLNFPSLQTEISLKELKSGTYTIRVSDKSGKNTTKLIQKL